MAQNSAVQGLSCAVLRSMVSVMPQNPAESEAKLRAARADLIRRERARQELTQMELASLCGISRSQLAMIETSQSGLSEDVLRAIASNLGIKEARLRNPQAELWRAA